MIQYERGGINYILKIFKRGGSVFPFALCVSAPSALLCGLVKWLTLEEHFPDLLSWMDDPFAVMRESQAWSGFSVLVGFLVVFRTSQAYNRFWDGCTSTHQMRAEWFDACSALMAFCRHSEAHSDIVMEFQHTLIRLFSMLHAVALAEIEDCNTDNLEHVSAFKYELVDAQGIDDASLLTIKNSDSKVELVYQWIQLLIVENIGTGVLNIPPPILSRSFQEIANGMVQFHEALKISTIPFPFPYAQTCDCLLLMHWVIAPFVICSWTTHPFWATVLCFVQVFILWCLNAIAIEIENPFGMDANDIDACSMQVELNRHLSLLVDPSTRRIPRLSPKAVWFTKNHEGTSSLSERRQSFVEVWTNIQVSYSDMPVETVHSVRRRSRRTSTTSSKNSEDSSLSYQDSHSGLEMPIPPSAIERLSFQNQVGGDSYSLPSVQFHVPWKRSISKDTGNSQTSSIPEEDFSDDQPNPFTTTPTPAKTSRYRCAAVASREKNHVHDVCPINAIQIALPSLPEPSDEGSGQPEVPSTKRCSPMTGHAGGMVPRLQTM